MYISLSISYFERLNLIEFKSPKMLIKIKIELIKSAYRYSFIDMKLSCL